MDKDLKKGIEDLFQKIRTKDIQELEGLFGSGIQDIKGLNEFKIDHIYKIIVHAKGGIEIIEE